MTHHQMSGGSLNVRTFQEKALLVLLGMGRTLTPRWERAPQLVAPPSLFTQQPIQVRVPRALADAVCILKQRIAVGSLTGPWLPLPSLLSFPPTLASFLAPGNPTLTLSGARAPPALSLMSVTDFLQSFRSWANHQFPKEKLCTAASL